MIDITSAVTVLAMVDNLRGQGSWAGETHVQKAMYFLDKECEIQTGFDFILYKHGPYSFDLHDSLNMLLAIGLLDHEITPPYGPRFRLTKVGEDFLRKHSCKIGSAEPSLRTVAEWFGAKGVADLEKLATALWVRIESPEEDEPVQARRVHELKPHISVEDALQALSTVKTMHS
ncbi:MAG: hypothetical protein JW718_07270 [Desulfovibrionaceae bacterium]|nr:hypothetical protein [Desulfovibrionaceae bacterium]